MAGVDPELGKGGHCAWMKWQLRFLEYRQLYQYLSVFLLFALVSDEPEVFLPNYSQTAILQAANFRRVVNTYEMISISTRKIKVT